MHPGVLSCNHHTLLDLTLIDILVFFKNKTIIYIEFGMSGHHISIEGDTK